MAGKKVLTPAKQTLVVFGLRESIHKTFGKYLASSVLDFHLTESETRFHYLVPPMLCQPKQDILTKENTDLSPSSMQTTSLAISPSEFPPNYLTTSACLAILDDLSSFACMAGDRTHRTGVSLSLSADLIHPQRMTALSEIDVLCKIDKIGRYVGFLTVEFIDRVDGKVLARGTHNKFLPTGFLWETLLSKPLFPLGFWLFNKFLGPHKYSTAIDFLFPTSKATADEARTLLLSTKRPVSLTSPLGSVWDLFPLTPANPISTDNSSDGKQRKYCYETEVTKATKNYVGLMHGGAVGSVIERACVLTRQTQISGACASASTQPMMIVDSMEVRYLAANKGKLVVEVWDDAEAIPLPAKSAVDIALGRSPLPTFSSRSIGVIRDQKTGAINTQFICHWRLV